MWREKEEEEDEEDEEEAWLRREVPPLEGEGPALDAGAAAHLAQAAVVRGHVLQEAAAQPQRLQQRADPPLQAALATCHRAKRLGDAQVPGQHDHGDLQVTPGDIGIRMDDDQGLGDAQVPDQDNHGDLQVTPRAYQYQNG